MARIRGVYAPPLLGNEVSAKKYVDSFASRHFKNAIIGGDYGTNPWQRGTSFSTIANGARTADGIRYFKSSEVVHSAIKTADAPTVAECGVYTTHCFHLDCTTADTSIGAAQYAGFRLPIEGYVWSRLHLRPTTLSFWVKATKTGTYSISLANNATNRWIVKEYTVNASNVWEKKILNFPASPAGTWELGTGRGLILDFLLAAGTDWQTSTLDSWESSTFKWASTNQVNGVDSTSNDFKLALIQLETGTIATPFEELDVQTVDELCQRYFFRHSELTREYGNEGYKFFPMGQMRTSTGLLTHVDFPVPMRVKPTATVSSGAAQFYVEVSGGGPSGDIAGSAIAISNIATNRAIISATTSSTTVGLAAGLAHRSGSGSYIDFDAELT